jgi:hypothetical protein
MRTAIFSLLLLLAAPALLAQSGIPDAGSPGMPLPAHPGKPMAVTPGITLTPQAQNWWAQPRSNNWRGPLLAQNRPFAFAMPSPQMPAGKMEPIPTQWPNAKFESIPTRWQNLKVVPAGGAAAAAIPATSSAALFASPERK